jgi:FrmR/RcnR family transcriptional regulator, repressor of frmRAB operon
MGYDAAMHTQREKEKLLSRVRRIAGQVRAVETALTEGAECSAVLHALTAARGAMHSLIVEVLEDHVRSHILDPDAKPGTSKARATQELLDVMQSYLR